MKGLDWERSSEGGMTQEMSLPQQTALLSITVLLQAHHAGNTAQHGEPPGLHS